MFSFGFCQIKIRCEPYHLQPRLISEATFLISDEHANQLQCILESDLRK